MPQIPLIEFSALPAHRGRRVCTAGLDLAVFKVGDAVFAIDDSCPHAGASLSSGKLDGQKVICPAHGLRFELGHSCAGSTPALEAKKHAVSVVDGMVMLDPNTVTPESILSELT
ncbi:MAG: Rieske 2Fe-2S domain-containing protein [Rhodoferax sp.]|uniref:Rieske (2Fe-2S) protein n=1 Tax=Rhodoferax sp. TaxID=50421 RepID=UPI002715ABF4|nr:Rieske 2Fe-2S domain-containing protein [Rhodoferax sp.]MDO8447903.1 Rieske 2Fe-2S domain-containing protein [Rhodoferax sp.]